MLIRSTRGRALTVAVSCVIHAAAITGILLAEHWIPSADAWRPPVLPVEVVTLAEQPPPPPEPTPEKERPKPIPKPVIRPPAPIEPPPPKKAAVVNEPPPEPRRPEPKPVPSRAAPEPAVEAPTPPPAAPRETVAAPAPAAPASPAPASSAPASPAPAGIPLAAAPDPTASSGLTPGSPVGKNGTPAGTGASSGPAVASAPSRDSGATGAITRSARPSGGYQVRPAYPASARRLGIQGTTLLRVHVLNDGRVGDIVVQQSAGHPDLDQAAAEAVRQWRFEPARRGSDAVAMWVLLPVEFQLK